MNHDTTLDAAINRGLAYMASVQLPNGSFASFMDNPTVAGGIGPATSTTVIPALILQALAHTHRPEAAATVRPLASWLLSQKSTAWTFPYWTIEADKAHDRLLSANLHSTFLALTALQSYDPSLIPAAALGNIARLLVNAESDIGGPYYTYAHIIARTTRPQIDIATNSSISHFITAVVEPLPKLTAHIAHTVKQRAFQSQLFTSVYATIYQLAPVVAPRQRAALARHILAAAQGGAWGNALDTAFALAALARLGTRAPAASIVLLAHMQHSDGSWEARPCCIAPDAHGYGSAALTTAIALEALSQHQRLGFSAAPPPTPVRRGTTPDTANAIYDAALALARSEIRQLSPPLRRHCLRMVNHISHHDKNREIILLGYFLHQSLREPPAINSSFLARLGTANLYNWVAYSIYDDFLDDEGDPELLSVANVAMRYSLEHFCQALPGHSRFRRAVRSLFDTLDMANAWEIEQCRFAVKKDVITIGALPRYGRRSRLAERSCTHSLPVIASLMYAGASDTAIIACYTAFRHYLIARQLNDDMHDWEEDVAAGHISYVVSAILEELDVQPGPLPLAGLLTGMRQQFWDHTLEHMCTDITSHVNRGRRAIARSGALHEQNIIAKLLDSLDSAAAYSVSERNNVNEFLAAYRKPLN